MPHMQMHVGGAERFRGNVVRLIHEPHSHVRSVLPIEHMFSHGQHQGLLRRCGRGSNLLAVRASPGGFAVVQHGAPASPRAV